MTDFTRLPSIFALDPCFLEAFGHHLVALDLAAETIDQLTGQDVDVITKDLIESAVKRYREMAPEEFQLLTQRFLVYAHQIAHQQH